MSLLTQIRSLLTCVIITALLTFLLILAGALPKPKPQTETLNPYTPTHPSGALELNPKTLNLKPLTLLLILPGAPRP